MVARTKIERYIVQTVDRRGKSYYREIFVHECPVCGNNLGDEGEVLPNYCSNCGLKVEKNRGWE